MIFEDDKKKYENRLEYAGAAMLLYASKFIYQFVAN
jgi:hypothetical protein